MNDHSQAFPSALSRPAGRLILAEAIRSAWYYDGCEAAYDRLITALDAFESMARAWPVSSPDRESQESALASRLRRKRQPITVDKLLELAIQKLDKHLASPELVIITIDTGFCFLPPQPGLAPKTGSEAGWELTRFSERTKALLLFLNQNGIYTDDLLVYRGVTQPGMMREAAYTLIQIPRYNREILVCDQVGEATFVGKGLRGPIFWATYSKAQLEPLDGITRLINHPDVHEQILAAVLADNPPGPKQCLSLSGRGMPMTHDLILTHALYHAKADPEGRLPTKRSGPVAALPGKNWDAIDDMLENSSNGLTDEYPGLSSLFNAAGLKTGRKINSEAVAAAIQRLETTGAHGLVLVPVTFERVRFSFDLILTHALYHAKADPKGRLPTSMSGPVATLPGKNWGAIDQMLYDGRNGLTDEYPGLSPLFNAAGLKTGNKVNSEAVATAIQRLETTGAHGLVLAKPLGLAKLPAKKIRPAVGVELA